MSITAQDLQMLLRQSAIDALRASPERQQQYDLEYRTRPVWRWLAHWQVLYFLFVPPYLALAILQWFGDYGAFGIHNLATLVAAIGIAMVVRARMKTSQVLSVLSHLPASDQQIAWATCRGPGLASLFLIYLNLSFYGVLMWQHPASWHWLEVVGLSVGQWFVFVATVSILNAWISERLLLANVPILMLCMIALACSPQPVIDQVATVSLLVCPTSWLNGLSSLASAHGPIAGLWILIPVAIWCLFGIWSQFAAVAAYRIDEFLIQSGVAPSAISGANQVLLFNPAAESADWRTSVLMDSDAPDEDQPTVSVADLAAKVRSREFLAPQDWSQRGWIERFVSRWLTPRERSLVEFVNSGRIRWTQLWMVGALQIPVFLAFAWYGGGGYGPAFMMSGWLAPVTALIAGYPAMRCRPCGGTYVAQLSLFPVGRDEVVTALMKVAAVRSLGILCFVLIPAAFLMLQSPFWPMVSIPIAVACGLLTLVIARLQVDWMYSLGTGFSDWRARNILRRFTLAGLAWLGGLSAYVTAVCTFFLGLPRVIPGIYVWSALAISAGLVVLCTIMYCYLIRKYYLNGTLDLVRAQPCALDRNIEFHDQILRQSWRAEKLRKKYGWFYWLRRDIPQPETK